jgi:tetratricopeptide (TPR) repeat protein
VLKALLAVAGDATGAATHDDPSAESTIERIATVVRHRIREHPQSSPVAMLNETVFGTLGFVREVDDADLRFVLLPSVLETRRGSCVGLGTLYLALGEALGWRSTGVMASGHFFVRIEQAGRTRNVELLRRGEEMSDEWYAARFPSPAAGASYMRSLSLQEVIGVIEYDIGNFRRRGGRLLEARLAYERAARDFPTFAEAHASLGATLHLLGALREADIAYRAAQRVNPALAGLDANLDLLHAEESGEAP